MQLIKPSALKLNEKIGFIAPASLPSDLNKIQLSKKYFENLGYKVVLGNHLSKPIDYLAAEDSERLEDFHNMFSDNDIKAIFCVRGGYGTGRLIDKINYQIIKNNPKIFVGYSDITVIQLAILKYAGLVTFSGPMPAVDFFDNISEFTVNNLFKVIAENHNNIYLNNYSEDLLEVLAEGKAKGRLIGGNLASLLSIYGTEFFPELNDSILFIEDIGENAYKVDRLLNQLKLGGSLTKLRGVLLGKFTEGDENKILNYKRIFAEYFVGMNVPIFSNVSFGHTKNILTIPQGVLCEMDSFNRKINIIESTVL